jgi:DNA polymerases epsilon N terminal
VILRTQQIQKTRQTAAPLANHNNEQAVATTNLHNKQAVAITTFTTMDKGQISKKFSLQGLQLNPVAMKYLITLVEDKNDPELIDLILSAIDKSTRK